jgi:hypothetical protein
VVTLGAPAVKLTRRRIASLAVAGRSAAGRRCCRVSGDRALSVRQRESSEAKAGPSFTVTNPRLSANSRCRLRLRR